MRGEYSQKEDRFIKNYHDLVEQLKPGCGDACGPKYTETEIIIFGGSPIERGVLAFRLFSSFPNRRIRFENPGYFDFNKIHLETRIDLDKVYIRHISSNICRQQS